MYDCIKHRRYALGKVGRTCPPPGGTLGSTVISNLVSSRPVVFAGTLGTRRISRSRRVSDVVVVITADLLVSRQHPWSLMVGGGLVMALFVTGLRVARRALL